MQTATRAVSPRYSLGFAGVKMIRRILGLAHVADLETVSDPLLRSRCERKALHFARELMVNSSRYPTIESVAAVAGGRTGKV